jgi:maltoporin
MNRLASCLRLRLSVITCLTLPFAGALQAQNSDSSDVAALKAQMEKMQKQYEDRISAMEAKMQALESKSESGSILNTHVLTDANGKQYESQGPAIDESFLKSLTRNFTFSAYVRAGVQFNGSGGGGDFHFAPPDNNGGRPRLGNENDTYMELTWKQAHMLGDNPDAMDVSMVFTPAIRYVRNRNTFISGIGGGRQNGSDFDFVLREAYLEMANVFKAAPEITFWAGQRFYDRFNFDPEDYYYLDMSGYGAGVKNIDVGIGKLWIAYLGGLDDDIASPTTGTFYKHSLDVRLKNIDVFGIGKLMLVGIANYEKGSTFTVDFNGNKLANPLRTDDAYGLGGGASLKFDLSAIGPRSYLELFALAGFGATNFQIGTDLGTITGFETAFLAAHPGFAGTINAAQAIQRSRTFRAGGMFVWNPNTGFSLGVWGVWNQDSEGFRPIESFTNPVFSTATIIKNTAGTRNLYMLGVTPYFWIADNIAIQGQAWWSYVDNVRGYQSNTNPTVNPGTLSPTAFGRSGNMGVLTIAPIIKPKGGYFSRPELRVFATYALWSDGLKVATTPIQEGNNLGGFTPSPYANGHANQG